ncbi:hypothetical protein [Actinopolymorpha rutila]|uniref:Uncharacterized protein n=1 Tax=Actinopolymorpha rutila TaxID=446787 RepID=A0A852ZMZ0_9ACTN|nr:hypothetical protein [Actinopolymorpha rutila]NYH90500.1 hypothetical protein [Actinopolymorpha rutila]
MSKHLSKATAAVGSAALLAVSAVISAPGTANAAGPQRPMTKGPRSAAQLKAPVASTAIRCEKDSSGRTARLYDGPSASYLYDRRFSPGPTVPHSELRHHTPQGVAWWDDWNGKGDDLLLVSAHNAGDTNGHVIGLDPRTPGKVVGIVALGPTHAGAIGLNGKWLFVDGPKNGKRHTINSYRLDALRAELRAGGGSLDRDAQKTVHGASFLTVDGSHLYAGRFNFHGKRDWMYRYTIASNGRLTLDPKPGTRRGLRWETPASTQGVAKVGNRFLFSTSSGRKKRSNLYVTNASQTNLDKASPRCFRAPTMAQGIAVTPGGRVYLNFESGSYEFDGSSGARARNVIPGTHTAKLSTLTGIPGGTLRLGTLHSKKQQDTLGEDEIAIHVEGQKLGPTIDIEQGQRKRIRKTIQFTGNARIRLYEKDFPDSDDYLGQRKLTPRKDRGILSFKRRGAHYRLSYSVR